MKQKIINRIIYELEPLRTLYPEIDLIISDLLNNRFQSLHEFINKYYVDTKYSLEFRDFLQHAIDSNILDDHYLSLLNLPEHTWYYLDLVGISIILSSSRPLNMKVNDFDRLKEKISLKDNNLKNDAQSDSTEEDEVLIFENSDIEILRKTILKSQLNYLNNVTMFIEDLENSSEFDIYHKLLNLNDIRYIQHCLSKLQPETLRRLLEFLEQTEKNSNTLINNFIKEVIKLNINNHKNTK